MALEQLEVGRTGCSSAWPAWACFFKANGQQQGQGFQGNQASELAPTLSEAVKQYGLRIENRKESIDMFIVTHIEKTPTAN